MFTSSFRYVYTQLVTANILALLSSLKIEGRLCETSTHTFWLAAVSLVATDTALTNSYHVKRKRANRSLPVACVSNEVTESAK